MHGTWVRVLKVSPRPGNPVTTALGSAPTVMITFRLNKTGRIPEQQGDMIRLMCVLLSRVPGNAMLHRELETIWLLRRDGEVTVTEQDDIWPPRRLALLGHSARRATHTFTE